MLNNEKSFLIFLSNLFYKLDCDEISFIDMIENNKSSVVYLEFNRFTGKSIVDRSIINKKLHDLQRI